MMAVGAFLAAVILVFTLNHSLLVVLAICMAIGAGVPTFPPIFRRLVRMLKVGHVHTLGPLALGQIGQQALEEGLEPLEFGFGKEGVFVDEIAVIAIVLHVGFVDMERMSSAHCRAFLAWVLLQSTQPPTDRQSTNRAG